MSGEKNLIPLNRRTKEEQKEISENEAFCMFIDNEYYMAMDFYEFRNRLEEAGAKITKN